MKGAVRAATGQFHDRHEPYSNFVLTVLEKISENYKRRDRGTKKDGGLQQAR